MWSIQSWRTEAAAANAHVTVACRGLPRQHRLIVTQSQRQATTTDSQNTPEPRDLLNHDEQQYASAIRYSRSSISRGRHDAGKSSLIAGIQEGVLSIGGPAWACWLCHAVSVWPVWGRIIAAAKSVEAHVRSMLGFVRSPRGWSGVAKGLLGDLVTLCSSTISHDQRPHPSPHRLVHQR